MNGQNMSPMKFSPHTSGSQSPRSPLIDVNDFCSDGLTLDIPNLNRRLSAISEASNASDDDIIDNAIPKIRPRLPLLPIIEPRPPLLPIAESNRGERVVRGRLRSMTM